MKKLRLALAQINPTMGDLAGNSEKILQYINNAGKFSADIAVFPELSVSGYPPEDLLFKHKFIEDNIFFLKKIAKEVKDITVIIGFVNKIKNNLYDAAAVIHDGKIAGIYHKILLPNYGVFDEKRYFHPGDELPVFVLNNITFGINICEDIWFADGPAAGQSHYGKAEVIIAINASPYHVQKWKLRKKMLRERALQNNVFIAYCNAVGGQDELIFDGLSMVVNPEGRLISVGRPFQEDLLIVDINITESLKAKTGKSKRQNEKIKIPWDEKKIKKIFLPSEPLKPNKNHSLRSEPFFREVGNKPFVKKRNINFPGLNEEIYQSLVLGTKDYVNKNNFKKVLIGMSGGIDSALTSAIAADAIGSENVTGVFMPSRYTSDLSGNDAETVSKNLGIKFLTISIEPVFKSYLESLSASFSGLKPDTAEENIQARIRGNILMALSNKFGWLPLATGNKSEMAVGYTTLYGDMAGGFAVIKDVPKTLVYKLAKYRNSISKVFPESILTKAPTAELKENQKDQDSLPSYEILDRILKAYVEEDRSLKEIASMGFNEEVVKKVINMVDRSEYKRRQSPPGIKITHRAFGKDRRLPITNKYNPKK